MLGAVGVLVAAAAVAAVGFVGAHGATAQQPPEVAAISTQSGQLPTFALHDEKPMRAIGKGVAAP